MSNVPFRREDFQELRLRHGRVLDFSHMKSVNLGLSAVYCLTCLPYCCFQMCQRPYLIEVVGSEYLCDLFDVALGLVVNKDVSRVVM